MKTKEEFYRDIDVFSKGANGYSPFIIDVLRGIEREFGGVQKEFIKYIEEKFKTTEKEVLDTVKILEIKILDTKETKEIRVCIGMHCKANGSDFVLDEFKKNLKIDVDEITDDGIYLLGVQRCFAKCNEGPNVKVGEAFYSGVKVTDVKKIIEENK